MTTKNEKLNATQRFERLRSMLETIELQMCEVCPRANALSKIAQIVVSPTLSDLDKLDKIKKSVSDYYGDEK